MNIVKPGVMTCSVRCPYTNLSLPCQWIVHIPLAFHAKYDVILQSPSQVTSTVLPTSPQEEKDEDMFFTAQSNTLLQKFSSSGRGNGTMVEKELDLGTLVIVDDQDEDPMDTMKSEGRGFVNYGVGFRGAPQQLSWSMSDNRCAHVLCRDGHRSRAEEGDE